MNWSDIAWPGRAALAAAFGVLVLAGLHVAGDPAYGVPGSVAVAASVAMIMFVAGGLVLQAIAAIVDFWWEWEFWWW